VASLACRLLGLPYGILAAARVKAYRLGLFPSDRPPLPVISVGNLSVGGTGKTPLVIHLLEMLRRRGLRAGVLSRGYAKAKGEALNDEGRLLAGRFPDLPQVQDPDRLAGARRLLAGGPLDALILDDAFQHLRIGRDLDLVCLSAKRPWFRDCPLPLGRLREFPSALKRAHLLVLTHLEGVEDREVELLKRKAREDSGGKPVLPARHRPRAWLSFGAGSREKASERDPADLAGKRVFLFSAIGSPRAFRTTVEGLGARVLGHRVFRDHHRFRPDELEALAAEARRLDAQEILTTEKDLARTGAFPFPAGVLQVDLEILEGKELLEEELDRLLGRGGDGK